MIYILAELGANKLACHNHDPQHILHYRYGLECLLNECITDILLFVIGIFTHNLVGICLWTIAFTVCRINMGGWHAPNHMLCISVSCLLGISSQLVIPNIFLQITSLRMVFYLIQIICIIYIMRHVPLHSVKHRITKHRCLIAKVICLLLSFCGIILFEIIDVEVGMYCAFGIWLSIGLAIFQNILNRIHLMFGNSSMVKESHH